jgi:NADPH-dependent curcumin reductase
MCKPDNVSSSSSSTNTTTRSWINKKWILVHHPDGHFSAKRDAKLIIEEMKCECSIDDLTSTLEADEVVVQVEALSVDAFLRTMLDESTAYHGNIAGPGSTLPALGYGIVVCTGPKAATKFKRGTRVMGLLGACTMATVQASELFSIVSLPFVPTSLSLGYLGTSGLTAYAGMFLALPRGTYPKRGETVVVSAAAGAVGSIAAQMAKCCGARVIGIAGGEKKMKFLLHDLGLHGAIDYKDMTKGSLQEQIVEQCPNGVDFYFDNVGGEMLNVVLNNINNFSRIVICGAISQYGDGSINNRDENNNKKNGVVGPSNYIKLAEKSSIMTGFNFMHFGSKIFLAIPYLLWHYFRGNIKVHEHVEDGIEAFPVALEKMFHGGTGQDVGDGHCGRLLIDVNGNLRRRC